jgi:hypothetical protein
VYTTLTGWSYYYMGHGGEIGYDAANGYPNSIPTDLTVFGGRVGLGHVDTITGGRKYVRSSDKVYWWGMPWLGELCPDSHYKSQWLALDPSGKATGNLLPGSGANNFYQEVDNQVYLGSRNLTAGTGLMTAVQRLKPTGCGMFFNIGTSTSTFNHVSSSGTGDLVGVGLELAANHRDQPTVLLDRRQPAGHLGSCSLQQAVQRVAGAYLLLEHQDRLHRLGADRADLA